MASEAMCSFSAEGSCRSPVLYCLRIHLQVYSILPWRLCPRLLLQVTQACLLQLLCLKLNVWSHLAFTNAFLAFGSDYSAISPWILYFLSLNLVLSHLKLNPLGVLIDPKVSHVPWTKAKLWAILKEFPEVTEDPHKFVKEFDIIIQDHQLKFSDLYHQLIHMLVGEGQAWHWMRIAKWEHPQRDLEKQTSNFWEDNLFENSSNFFFAITIKSQETEKKDCFKFEHSRCS